MIFNTIQEAIDNNSNLASIIKENTITESKTNMDNTDVFRSDIEYLPFSIMITEENFSSNHDKFYMDSGLVIGEEIQINQELIIPYFKEFGIVDSMEEHLTERISAEVSDYKTINSGSGLIYRLKNNSPTYDAFNPFVEYNVFLGYDNTNLTNISKNMINQEELDNGFVNLLAANGSNTSAFNDVTPEMALTSIAGKFNIGNGYDMKEVIADTITRENKYSNQMGNFKKVNIKDKNSIQISSNFKRDDILLLLNFLPDKKLTGTDINKGKIYYNTLLFVPVYNEYNSEQLKISITKEIIRKKLVETIG